MIIMINILFSFHRFLQDSRDQLLFVETMAYFSCQLNTNSRRSKLLEVYVRVQHDHL